MDYTSREMSSTTSSSGLHVPVRLPALPLERLVSASRSIPGVRRRDLRPGDRLIVSTRNSIYSLLALAGGQFRVSGGFFARDRSGERVLPVSGCTAGGHALFAELVAAPGMFLEFGDGTRTTRIRTVRLLSVSSAEFQGSAE
ncbi:MAG: hypothetical protein R2862_09940 [Thermoanaerobaculia bacterium]